MSKETIGRYEIQSEIGRGGMAVVYLAYDPNFRRNVAIKLVSVNLNENNTFKERFEREAHLIAKIEHPAIVPVYDFGEDDNQPYLVMRHMSGGSLANKIKDGALSFEYTTQLISKIAPALDAVHAEGIVHRDLKPANILLDGFGNPAISDFGIAHLTVSTVDLTGSAIIGTPSYMSPEQVSGEDLDARSDIYALGVIVFEMLTGRGPFQATTPMSVALKHITEPVPSILALRSELPFEVDSILKKALAKDRNSRYASASELAHDLEAIKNTLSFKDDSKPIPIKTSHKGDIATEIEVEDSLPSFDKVAASQSTPQSRPVTSATPVTDIQRPKLGIIQIIAILGVLFLLFIFCSSMGLLGTWAGFTNFFSKENQSTTPTLVTTQATVLYADDFSDPTSGWPTVQNTQGGYGYQQDGYHIFVDELNSVFWAKTNRTDDNISIYADATPVSANQNGYYGLLCRIQDDQNFYYFVIQSNSNYNIGKYKNAEFQPLLSGAWMRSAAINQGNQANRLRADCSGNRLKFYANDILLGEVIDTDFTSGFSGILAANLDSGRFEVIFNNFLITEAD